MQKVKRISFSAVTLLLALSLAVAGSTAYFSDTETSTNNILQAGAIDLTIDNESYYNGEAWPETTWELKDLEEGDLFFNFQDLKPGDWGEDTISLHVESNDAWVCVDVDLTANDDVSSVEPELSAGDVEEDDQNSFDGELAEELYFVFWADDGDNVWENGEEILTEGFASEVLDGVTWPIADSTFSITDGPLVGEENYFIGKAWCFGNLEMEPLIPGDYSPLTAGNVFCNGASASNMSQTDMLMGDFTFRAIQSRHNEDYECERCEEEGDGWANDHTVFDQGLRKNVSAVPGDRSDPTKAYGPADGKFVSLGYGGELVLVLTGPIEGSTVSTIEVTFGRAGYPEETADVYVSEDGSDWRYVGEASNKDGGGVSAFDITGTGLDEIRYVKIVDTSDSSLHNSTSDGFDLDAVGASVCLDRQKTG